MRTVMVYLLRKSIVMTSILCRPALTIHCVCAMVSRYLLSSMVIQPIWALALASNSMTKIVPLNNWTI